MYEDLTELRKETEQSMFTALRNAEQFSFLSVRMCNLSFLSKRSSFIIKKGFKTNPNDITITIFGDGDLIFAEKVFLLSTELVYNVSKKYSNLPLKDYNKVRISVTSDNDVNNANKYDLFMLNAPGKILFPITFDQYRMIESKNKLSLST